jgi:hypothetical protein
MHLRHSHHRALFPEYTSDHPLRLAACLIYQEAGQRISGLKAEFSDKAVDLALLEAEVYTQQGLEQQGFDVSMNCVL